jgi:protein tyrosine phosphatase
MVFIGFFQQCFCTGPLSTTTADFWIMTWESQSPLIVMLTSLNERGRSKCFHYWPEHPNAPMVHHDIQVTTVHTKNQKQWIYREFTLKHLKVHKIK